MKIRRNITQGQKYRIKKLFHELQMSTSAFDKQKASIVEAMLSWDNDSGYGLVKAESYVHQGDEWTVVQETQEIWNELVDQIYSLIPNYLMSDIKQAKPA